MVELYITRVCLIGFLLSFFLFFRFSIVYPLRPRRFWSLDKLSIEGQSIKKGLQRVTRWRQLIEKKENLNLLGVGDTDTLTHYKVTTI